MESEIHLYRIDDTDANYISWAPVECAIKLVNTQGQNNPINVKLKNKSANHGGK
jgi:hypothetical protein